MIRSLILWYNRQIVTQRAFFSAMTFGKKEFGKFLANRTKHEIVTTSNDARKRGPISPPHDILSRPPFLHLWPLLVSKISDSPFRADRLFRSRVRGRENKAKRDGERWNNGAHIGLMDDRRFAGPICSNENSSIIFLGLISLSSGFFSCPAK